MKLFVSQNTDVAQNLHQEFMRIRTNREYDRLAIVTGMDNTILFLFFVNFGYCYNIIIIIMTKMNMYLYGQEDS